MVNMNIKGSKEQKKIITQSGIFFLVIVLVFVFIYLPQRRKVIEINEAMAGAKKEIKEIKSAAQEGESLEGAVGLLEKKLVRLESMFPYKEEGILKDIQQIAHELGIEIDSIQPRDKMKVDWSSKIEGRNCFELPITLDIKCSFKTLINYLKELVDEFPSLLTVNHVSMGESRSQESELQIKINLSAYLLIKE